MNTPYQKPGLFTAIAVMTLVSGIVNLFWGFIASITVLSTFIGVVCLPLTILPTVLGIFEIIYAAKLLTSQPQPVQPSQTIAVFEILSFLYGNVFSMVVGILALVFYNDLAVKEYFARLNGTVPPSPTLGSVEGPAIPDSEPFDRGQDNPAPESSSEVETPVEPPQPEETPEKPKRIRKEGK